MNYKRGDKKVVKLKTLDELKKYLSSGRYHHSSKKWGANLSIAPNAKEYFGDFVEVSFRYKKPGRNIWEFKFNGSVRNINKWTTSQMIYDEWFEDEPQILKDELFEI